MERILEPQLMDDWAQAEAYAKSDFSEPHNIFVQRFTTLFPEFSKGLVVDLGCGTADPTVRFARRYPSVTIVGIDGSTAMLEYGQNAIISAGLSERIKLVERLLPDHGCPHGIFNAVISNSLLHHLPNPNVLWISVKELTVPGVPVFVMDLTRPINSEHARSLVRLHTLDSDPELMKEDYYNSLLASFRPEEVWEQLDANGLSNKLHVEVVSDRHIMIYGRI